MVNDVFNIVSKALRCCSSCGTPVPWSADGDDVPMAIKDWTLLKDAGIIGFTQRDGFLYYHPGIIGVHCPACVTGTFDPWWWRQ